MTLLPTLSAARFQHEPALLANALRTSGACWIAGWPDAATRAGLRADLRRLRDEGALSPAAVGRAGGLAVRAGIRADTTCWLDDPRCGPQARAFLARMDTVVAALNRALYLGIDEFQAHYAAYPPGGGYARHRDRFRDSDTRVVSWVTYLNDDDWAPADGGALRLHADADADGGADEYRGPGAAVRDAPADGVVDLPPVGGSVCFLSERAHEVLPARRERLSIAGWMQRRAPVRPIR